MVEDVNNEKNEKDEKNEKNEKDKKYLLRGPCAMPACVACGACCVMRAALWSAWKTSWSRPALIRTVELPLAWYSPHHTPSLPPISWHSSTSLSISCLAYSLYSLAASCGLFNLKSTQ